MMRYGKQQLNTELENKLIERMKEGKGIDKQTAANKIDVALHYLYRGLLTDDQKLIQFSVDQLFEPIQLVYNNEGIQYDYSYLQHGPQLQIASYGSVFFSGILKVADLVRETEFALKDEKLTLFSKFYRETYLKSIRGSVMDFTVAGCGISRANALNNINEQSKLEIVKNLDPKHSNDWDAAIARTSNKKEAGYEITPYHKQFWVGDYVQHSRNSYAFNVRMVSKRTYRIESINKEYLFGKYICDGATNIQLHGSEYYNIMPVWEWDKIPGITSRDYTTDRIIDQYYRQPGTTDFVGGVSDGIYGTSAYTMDCDSVQAKKSWFFFDKEIVCLGAGINSNTTESITSTINQCWLNGNVQTIENKNVGKGKILEFKNKNHNWVLHDGIGYYIPQEADLSLSTEVQNGNWYQINNAQSKKEISGDVFKLWINHGHKPINAKYAYIVIPGLTDVSDLEKFKESDIQIVTNTENIQAVYHKSLDMVQAVFYQADTLKLEGMEITTDKP